MKNRLVTGVLLLVFASSATLTSEPVTAGEQNNSLAEARAENYDWPVYGGTAENNHYSPLTNINQRNVKKLATA